jgi:hypothetical protein
VALIWKLWWTIVVLALLPLAVATHVATRTPGIKPVEAPLKASTSPPPAACFEARTVGICSHGGYCWSWPKPGCADAQKAQAGQIIPPRPPPPATAPLLLCGYNCGDPGKP